MKVAVAGGTGLAGSHAVRALQDREDEVVILSRGQGVNLISAEGLAEALVGVEAIIDATSTVSMDRAESERFFATVATNLQQAASDADVHRIVTLSIVGLESMASRAHYAGKLAQEKATREGAVEAVILRATQFHDFARQYLGWMRKGPVVPVPMQQTQTVDLAVVGEQLARLAHADPGPERWPVSGTVEVAGPQQGQLVAQVRRVVQQLRQRVLVLPIWLPGAEGKAARRGGALPGPDAIIAGRSFDAWLAEVR